MNLDQAGQLPGRTASFQDGVNGTPNMTASGLNKDAAVFNSKVPGQFTPHSVLQDMPGMSGNGMSAADKSRLLPGGYQLPSPNGASQQSYEKARLMRLMSGSDEV